MSEVLELLTEALEDADRKTLNEIALEEFGEDYTKVKKRNDEIRAELIDLANKKYGDELDVEVIDTEGGEDTGTDGLEKDNTEDKAALAAKVRAEAIEKMAKNRKPRKIKNTKTGRVMTWTERLDKMSHMVEVE